ncbi:DUF6114 domain-containing protein [Streptomyces sp. HU2014]|uniref:DUF6114 domain-containing protein n=1 Tax=Streptomyces sp. HU2014 TaxID=2939414 RepID=UPI00200D314D|nr:DUF6114 domain-containing protein [Streptomyces sp. HU2014]UQI47813.1 DUF6114 domain-containing protein [Streptomyces sp. HU2014]
MSADTRPRQADASGSARTSFREWRGRRPFWGGLWTLLAGIPIMYIPYQTMTLGDLHIRLATTAGAGSLIIGVLLVVLGLTLWFQRQSRIFAGVAAILLALVSLVVSNFGAFLIGFLLALIGGALGVSWVPGKPVAAAGPDGSDVPDAPDVPDGPDGKGDEGLEDDRSPLSLTKETNGRHRAD